MSVSEITETRQYLTFKLGNEVFATDVAKVREVLDLTTITAIPRTPEFMSGVINLRGSVVPVVDLRLCFETLASIPGNVESRAAQRDCHPAKVRRRSQSPPQRQARRSRRRVRAVLTGGARPFPRRAAPVFRMREEFQHEC